MAVIVVHLGDDGALVARRRVRRASGPRRHQQSDAVVARADAEAPSVGGCVWVKEGSSIVLDTMTLTGCSAQYGGGLGVEDSRATVRNTALYRNGVEAMEDVEVKGGGAYFRNSSGLVMENVTVSENYLEGVTVSGGGVYVTRSSGVVIRGVRGGDFLF